MVWQTRDHRQYQIYDMDDAHLIHSVLLIERKLEADPSAQHVGVNFIPRLYPVMMQEIEYRDIKKRYHIQKGDVRGVILAAAEIGKAQALGQLPAAE